jgi:hypothetical protein
MSKPRKVEEIQKIVDASAWAESIPDDRTDPCWKDLRDDLGLSGPELSSFKNKVFEKGELHLLKSYVSQLRNLLNFSCLSICLLLSSTNNDSLRDVVRTKDLRMGALELRWIKTRRARRHSHLSPHPKPEYSADGRSLYR